MSRLTPEQWSTRLIKPLYQERYLQTLWNAENPKNRKQGWRLKNGNWAPWFYNMRPVGSSPALFSDICRAMSDLVYYVAQDISLFIAVEMAAINISGGTAVASLMHNDRPIPVGYTRPLPAKARTPEEALFILQYLDIIADFDRQKLLDDFDRVSMLVLSERDNKEDALVLNILAQALAESGKYGQKEFVEARMRDGDTIAIMDDMATDLGSKLIARLITLWAARQRGIQVSCDKILYFLNRGIRNKEKGLEFANHPNQSLMPAPLEVHYVIEFDHELSELRSVMKPDEYEVITAFQQDSAQFQDPDVQRNVLELAA